jgi:hypothetical protein
MAFENKLSSYKNKLRLFAISLMLIEPDTVFGRIKIYFNKKVI